MREMAITFREALDNLHTWCDGVPACEDPVGLVANCHPERSTLLCGYYDGIVTMRCPECGDIVVEIAIARKPKDEESNGGKGA